MIGTRVIAGMLLALAVSDYASARQAPLTDEDRNIVQVFEVPGHTKDEIFLASKMWLAENFKSAKAVVEYEDKSEGAIIGNGRTSFICEGGWVCRQKANTWIVVFKMKIEAKDGRFRLAFTDVYIDGRECCQMPINDREDMDNVRATLLKFGPQIVASIGRDNW
jgi:hypothetical protein